MNGNFVRVAHVNVRSLLPKLNDLALFISINKIDVVAISETWLNDSIRSDNVHIDNYNFFRRDRVGRGGGVGLYVHRAFSVSVIECDGGIEQLWAVVGISGRRIGVGAVYSPPQSNVDLLLDGLEDALMNCLLTVDEIYCCGDFNIDILKTNHSSVTRLQSLLDEFEATQIIDEPTRVTETSASLLDIIITTENVNILGSGVLVCHLSDHDSVFCDIRAGNSKVRPTFRTYRDLDHMNFDHFNDDLQCINFNYMLSLSEVDDKLSFLNQQILSLFNKHAPLITRRFTKKFVPWLTDNLKLLMSMRDKAKNKFRRSRNPNDWNYYKSLRNLTNKTCKLEKRAYFEYISRNRNSAFMWSHLKLLGLSKSSNFQIPDHLRDAEKINNYFINCIPTTSVGASSGATASVRISIPPCNLFHFKTVSINDINGIIGGLKSTATGSDGINIKMLRVCCPFLTPYIVHIINSCILQNIFPGDWKRAAITPIPKKQNIVELKDLRPISILPTLSKVFEHILERQIKTYVEECCLLPDIQSGFRAGYSCTSALLGVTSDILEATDRGEITVLVLLDYSKAFDTVNHKLLLEILKKNGFSQNATSLLESYLCDRFQFVRIGEQCSRPLPVSDGVPQGSILSPILFSLYTSSFCDVIKHMKCHLYADDTQLYYSFKPRDWREAVAKINEDLANIYAIAIEHALHINPTKCQFLIFGKNKICDNLKNSINLYINNIKIPFTHQARNLGLLLDNTFRYRDQISKYINLAFLNLRKLYPHRANLTVKTKKILCETFVLSHFRYCSEIYHSCLDYITSYRIQKIQNACLRYIYGIRKFDHVSHKLMDIGWLSMRGRRELQTLFFYHKIITTKSPPYLYNKIRFRTDVHNVTTRFRGLISPPYHRTALFERSFVFCIYKKYNELPDFLKACGTATFKLKLRPTLM